MKHNLQQSLPSQITLVLTGVINALILLLYPPCVYASEPDDTWDLANGLYIRGETYYDEAIELYRDFIEKYPEDQRAGLATFRLAEIYRKRKDFKQALTLYHRHQKYNNSPIRLKVDFRIGQMYYFLQDYTEGEAFLSKTFNSAGDTSIKNSAGYYLGKVYFDTRRFDKAAATLQSLADDQDNPFYPFANYFLAESLEKIGEKQQAAQRYELVSGTAVSVAAESTFKAANIYAALNQYEKSYQTYLSLTERFPTSPYVPEAALGALISLYNRKQYQQVDESFQQLAPLLDEKTKPAGLMLHGNSLFELKKYTAAIRLFNTVLHDFPQSSETEKARYKICWSHFLNQDFDRAIECALELIKLHPENSENPSILFLLAESYYKQGIVLEALERYQSVLDTTDTESLLYQKALYKKAVCMFDQQSFSQSGQLFMEFATAYPENRLAAEAMTYAARSEIELGEFEEAAAILEDFLAKYQDHELARDVMYQLGLVYAAVDRYQPLVRVYQEFEQQFPDDRRRAEVMHWLGTAFEAQGDPAKALEYYESALAESTDPKLAHRTRYRLAQIYYKSGRLSESAEMVYQVLVGDTEVQIPSETHLWAADYLLDQKQHQRAIRLYRLYTEKYPGSFKTEKAFFGIGEAYFKEQKWTEALSNYRRAMQLPGEWNAFARLRAGMTLAKLDKNDSAIELLEQSSRSQLPAIESQAFFNLGEIYLQLADRASDSERARLFEKALHNYLKVEILYRDAVDRPDAMLRIGEIWQKRLNSDEAEKQYRRLIEEYPESDQAKTAAERMAGFNR